MERNIGDIDKALRIVLGLALILFGILNDNCLGIMGILPMITAFINWCPVYTMFRMNTREKETYEI